MCQVLGLEPVALGLRKPPSLDEEDTGQPQGDSWAGCTESGPVAPHSSSQAACGIASGPAGTPDRLPLLLLPELLMGSIQVLQHLQQAGSCFSLPSQGIRTGP